jgi:hypothetical protein
MTQVFPRHVRSAQLCTRGARAWFKANDLDWSRFIVQGLPSEVLLATGDPLAARAVAAAEREAASGRG